MSVGILSRFNVFVSGKAKAFASAKQQRYIKLNFFILDSVSMMCKHSLYKNLKQGGSYEVVKIIKYIDGDVDVLHVA